MITVRKVVLMAIIAIAYFVFDTLLQAGYFTSIKNTSSEEIRKVKDIWGPEDIEWDRENNLLYISATNWRKVRKGMSDSQNGVYTLNSNDLKSIPKKMGSNFTGEFNPHGISLFKKEGRNYIYVVNHTSKGSSVELFEIEGLQLNHLRSYRDELMFSPNDVVGDEIDQFYVTNDHGNRSGRGKMIENYLRMPYSYLLYYNGSVFRKVHQGLVYANGVQLSKDGQQIYLSHTVGRELLVLDRNRTSGELKLNQTIHLSSGGDNIDVDDQGNIWIAAHPKLMKFMQHAKKTESLSPSQVFKVYKENGKYVSRKVYENDGSQISGSSVAVVKADTMFIGCVFENNILQIKI